MSGVFELEGARDGRQSHPRERENGVTRDLNNHSERCRGIDEVYEDDEVDEGRRHFGECAGR